MTKNALDDLKNIVKCYAHNYEKILVQTRNLYL